MNVFYGHSIIFGFAIFGKVLDYLLRVISPLFFIGSSIQTAFSVRSEPRSWNSFFFFYQRNLFSLEGEEDGYCDNLESNFEGAYRGEPQGPKGYRWREVKNFLSPILSLFFSLSFTHPLVLFFSSLLLFFLFLRTQSEEGMTFILFWLQSQVALVATYSLLVLPIYWPIMMVPSQAVTHVSATDIANIHMLVRVTWL